MSKSSAPAKSTPTAGQNSKPITRARFRRHYNALLISILALLIMALLLVDFDRPGSDLPEAASRFPDAYLFDMETREFNSEGEIHYTVRALSAHYFSGDQGPQGYAVFSEPRMTVHGERGAPWRLQAERGQGDATGDNLSLIDNVRLWQSENGVDVAELLTDELHINLRARYAETGKTVTMRSEQSLTTAVGLRAFLDEETVELLSEVESIYEP